MVIFFVDGFLIAVLVGFAFAMGYTVLNSLIGVASVFITILCILLYAVVLVLSAVFLYEYINDYKKTKNKNALYNIIYSVVSSALAIYMTHICAYPFIGIEIEGVFDILSSVFAIMFYSVLWFSIIGSWAKAHENRDFSFLYFLLEIGASLFAYWILHALNLV